MTIKDKILVIQKQTAYSQEKLAHLLDVSFVTLNSWVNERSQPRKKAGEKIDELYAKTTGGFSLDRSELNKKFGLLLEKRKNNPRLLETILNRSDLADEFMLALTYHSNRIEGNTLTEDETASVLFNRNPLPDKTFIEQLEVKNHQTALLYLWKHVKIEPFSEKWILKLHGMLMNGIREDAGSYRNHTVRIVGSYVPTANFLKIPILMKQFMERFKSGSDKSLNSLAVMHADFEKIHPFSDGNGRIGRLLMHAVLLEVDFSPALIREERRQLYYTYLRKAQMDGDSSLLEDFLMDAVLEGYSLLE